LEQLRGQSPEQSRAPWQFQPGISGNPRGRESRAERQARVAQRATELAEPYGGLDKLPLADRIRLEQAAELLLRRRPRTYEDQVRVCNSLDRLLRYVERRHPIEKSEPSFAELLEQHRRSTDGAP
jgi:hypothetical protein